MSEHEPRSARPTLDELRAVVQPPSVVGRRNSEHWAGTLYLRRMSLHFTRLILPTGISANGVTWLMIPIGILAAVVLAIPTWWAVLLCALLIQFQILVDCSDGEVARWRRTSSPMGVYLDRVAHYVTEAALPIGLGIHVDGGFTSIGGWTTIGALVGCLVVLKKSFGDLVLVARLYFGLAKGDESAESGASRSAGLRSARSLLRFFPFFRAFVAIEYTLITLFFATVDVVLARMGAVDDGVVLRGWMLLSLPLALATAGGFLMMIVTSRRFDA